MKLNRTTFVASPILALLALGVSILPIAPAKAAPACSLYAKTPEIITGSAVSVGGRHGCTNMVSWLRVSMFHKTVLIDEEIGRTHAYDVVRAQAQLTAVPKNGWDVYTKVESSNGSVQKSGLLRFVR